MHIVVIPGSNYNNAPAGFSAAVDYVVNLFDNLYTANVTVYINVDYGQIDSTNATVPPLGIAPVAVELGRRRCPP
jgi:hypothetical protein